MYNEKERRLRSGISNDEMEAIAQRAAEILREGIYAEIGRHLVRRVLLISGAAMAILYAWIKGWIPPR